MDHRNRRLLFSVAGLRDRIAVRLTTLVEHLTVTQDDLSQYACKACVSKVNKLDRIQSEAYKLKAELVNGLMETTLRHRVLLRWEDSSHLTPAAQPTDPVERLLKRPAPATPQSASKPASKRSRTRQTQLPSPSTSHDSREPSAAVRIAHNRPVTAVRTLFSPSKEPETQESCKTISSVADDELHTKESEIPVKVCT